MKTHYRYDATIGRVIEVPLTNEEREEQEDRERCAKTVAVRETCDAAPRLYTGLYL